MVLPLKFGETENKPVHSFIDECLEIIRKLMESDFAGPVNIGSEEMVSINDFAKMAISISGKTLTINNIEGPTGVRGGSLITTRSGKNMAGQHPCH